MHWLTRTLCNLRGGQLYSKCFTFFFCFENRLIKNKPLWTNLVQLNVKKKTFANLVLNTVIVISTIHFALRTLLVVCNSGSISRVYHFVCEVWVWNVINFSGKKWTLFILLMKIYYCVLLNNLYFNIKLLFLLLHTLTTLIMQ